MSRASKRRRQRLGAVTYGATDLLCNDFEPSRNTLSTSIVEVEPDGPRLQKLQERVAEVEGWYRLLTGEHAALRSDRDRLARHAEALQSELTRIKDEAEALRLHVDRLETECDPEELSPRAMQGTSPMNWIVNLSQRVWKQKAVLVAVVALATMIARDPAVSNILGSTTAWIASTMERSDQESESDGYVRYAQMVTATSQYEEVKQWYNENEASLSGDTLLEAQDRLRAARLRDLEARLAFLPELARHCAEAGVPVPEGDAAALAAIEAETVFVR